MAAVMLTFGSGGHSTEMLMLLQNAKIRTKLNSGVINKLICVISEDDKLILNKLEQELDLNNNNNKIAIVTLRRGRKVGQSYFTSIWTTLISIILAIRLVSTHKPTHCLTNGPALSVIITFVNRFLQLITMGMMFKCHIIYIESFCRTKTLSLTGRIIYHLRLANEFYVQWPNFQNFYPRTQYKGILV